MTDCKIEEMFELPQKLELISEEKLPSLYSYSSLSNSICSDSTIDLDELIHNQPANQSFEKRGLKPLQNNFFNANIVEQSCNERTDEIVILEHSLEPVKKSHLTFSKSVSLHDVSNITALNLTAKSNTVSCETINSQSLSSTTKSKDSGFQRSLSCLSLTSGKRSYDHVQSKVKAYIQNIKESEALNKKNKLKKQEQPNELVVLKKESEEVCLVEKDDLLREIQKLKFELYEKSLYIDAQQANYNKLLLKFAEARNIIDELRVQSMSLSHRDDNESKNQILSLSNINLALLDHKSNRTFGQLSSCIVEEEVLESSNDFVKEHFQPILHSSPFEKSLSPVRKIFSSSSRLDKHFQPLTNLKQCRNPQINSQVQNTCKEEALAKSFDGASRNDGVLLNNHSKLLRHQSMSIDLPNDDPFDKVKKWQASLPSINLLGCHSSSDCEDSGHSNSPAHNNPKKSEGCCLSKCFTRTKGNEIEICNVLSQELQNKCIITDMEIDSERQETSLKNNRDIKRSVKNKGQPGTCVMSIKTIGNEKMLYANNKSLSSKKKCEVYLKRQNNTSKNQNCIVRRNSVEAMFPPPEFKQKLINMTSRESSVSDGDSTHLPKSSSISHCRTNKLDNDNDSSDDSSSISSSVLGSGLSVSVESSKRTKRKLIFGEVRLSSKVPKTTDIHSKSSQTTFILKEPMLNFNSNFENSGSQMNNQISKSNRTNSDSCLKRRNTNYSTNSLMKTESSQRKAWNARNNANFYVCKDFPFSKSASLLECIRDMEGLVSKGSYVISSVIGRNSPTC